MKIVGLRRDVACGLAMVFALCAPRLVAQTRDTKPVPQQPRVPLTPPVVMPPRDRPPEARVGTGSIAGRVIDGTTGRPLARARVRLTSGGQPARGPVLTDADGAFAFSELPAGSHNLVAERNGYLPASFPENRSMRTRNRPLLVGPGETRDVVIAMFRGASLSGRVVDAYGEPVDSAMVTAHSTGRGGRGGLRGQAQTNDLGEFRIPRLTPGRYVVNVRALSGYQNDPGDQPLPQSLPTYYPGTLLRDKAQVITVSRAQAIAGLELTLVEGLPSIVNGVVVALGGEQFSGGSVTARAVRDYTGLDGGAQIRPDGSFRFQLPPGEYYLEARLRPGVPNQPPPPGARPENDLFGTARLKVGGGGHESLAIVVGKGATASGRITFEGAMRPPASPGTARVPIFPMEAQTCQGGQATIADDWTFKVEGLMGTCSATMRPTFGAWTVKSVTFRGRNVMDDSFTFEPGQHYGDVQIVVTDRRSEILLRVSDEAGQITREFVAIAFPTDRSRWANYPRYVQAFSPPPQVPPAAYRPNSPPAGPAGLPLIAPSGRIAGLPPGEYYIIAVDDIEFEDTTDPEVLGKLASSASRIVVSDEAPVEANLQRQVLADVVR